MSLSKPQKSNRNPAKYFLEWIGDRRGNGGFKYYDKELEWEEGGVTRVGKNITITGESLNRFSFIVLDESMFSIGGFKKMGNSGCGIWSNEIPQFKAKELELTVRLFDKDKTVIGQGLYGDIKDTVKGHGGKFCRSVYAYTTYFGDPTLIMIKMSGSSLTPWMNLMKESESGSSVSIGSHYVKIDGIERFDDAAIPFVSPKFGFGDKFEEPDLSQAIDMDKGLQDYFVMYLGGTLEDNDSDLSIDEDTSHEVVDNIASEDEIYDTSKWGVYNIPGTSINLGESDLEELKKMKKELESVQDFGETYANVCEGVRYHQQNGDDEPPVTVAPDAEENIQIDPSPKPNNPFTSKDTTINWKEVVIEETGGRLGDMSLQDIKDGLEFAKSEDGKDFAKYIPDMEIAIKDLEAPPANKNPFAK